MIYKITNLRPCQATWEVIAILDGILKKIQVQRRSPDVSLHLYADMDTRAFGFLATKPDPLMSRRIFQMSFLKNGQVHASHIKRWREAMRDSQVATDKKYSETWTSHGVTVSLHDPDSIERLRGMIEKGCRVYANALAARARRPSNEQPSARRSRGSRLARPLRR